MNLITAGSLKYLKIFTIGTLITGMYLHLSLLIFGMDNLQHYLFTPMFEIFFAMPMVIAGVFQVAFIRKIAWKNKLERIIFYLCTFQFIVSIPLHIRAFIVGNTDYVRGFPPAISVIEILMWGVFIYVFACLNKWELKIQQQ